MRAIEKRGSGGYALEKAHTDPPQTAEQAQSRWKSFSDTRELLSRLIAEQASLCCYSELRADEEGLGYHIEHIENKSQNPQRTFDYQNLAASALASDSLAGFQREDIFGGHAARKQAGCDLQRFISCHQPDSFRFFAYLSDGRVVPRYDLNPTETDRAIYTIELLNLNSPYLINLRRRWWQELDQLVEQHLQEEWSLAELASVCLTPYGKPIGPRKMERFPSLSRQFFGVTPG